MSYLLIIPVIGWLFFVASLLGTDELSHFFCWFILFGLSCLIGQLAENYLGKNFTTVFNCAGAIIGLIAIIYVISIRMII